MEFIHIPFLFLYTLALVLLIISFILIKHHLSIWLLLTLAVFSGGLFLSNSYILAYPHIRNFTFYKSEPVTIRGVVGSFPEIKPNSSTFVLTAQELIWAGKVYPVCGKVLVKIFRKVNPAPRSKSCTRLVRDKERGFTRCGVNISFADQVILEGKLFRPYQARDGQPSYRKHIENQGIYSILTVSKNKPIRYLGKSRVNPLKSFVYKIRNKSADILSKNLKSSPAGIFSAMILGERSKIPPYLNRLFIQTGTVHILAISGLHVGIIAFILELLLKALRIRRRLRYLVIIFLLILYCLLTGARSSVIRATIMAIVLLSGFLLKKETQITHSLSLAALIILMANPRELFNIGFQLSFISVISIVYLSLMIKNLCNPKFNLCNHKSIRFFISAFSVSLAAWLGTSPFIAHYFKIISPITVLANLVVVPYLTLVIALGFNLLIVGFVFPALAGVFSAPANLSIVILIQIVKFFNQIPCAYFYL